MVAYADTSFLLSLYTADTNHEAAVRLFRRGRTVLPFTPLQRHELRNALRLQVFRKDITEREREAVIRDIEADVHDGFLVDTALVWAECSKKRKLSARSIRNVLGSAAWISFMSRPLKPPG
jgi:hypothetical protein